MKFGIGQPVRRTEDLRFVTGQGRYTDDLHFEREAFVYFLRSPHAHARISAIDVRSAKNAPGVIGVFTQDDVEAFGCAPMPCHLPVRNRDGSDYKQTPKTLLAGDRVRFAGEAVAMIVADTLAHAKDAAELVSVDYEPLDAVGTLEAAPFGPLVWDHAPDNLCFDWAAGDEAKVRAAFDDAAFTAHVEVVQNRLVANAMETRNAIGVVEGDRYTLYTSTQGAGQLRDRVIAVLPRLTKESLRVVTPDVGGGFGMKGFMYPEQPLVLVAAKLTGRPCRWSGERTEAFLCDDAGRDMRTRADIALDRNGGILAVHIKGTANMGGYLSQVAPFIPTLAGGRIFGGLYRVPALFAEVKCYFTNTAPVDAYRGAGRPEAAYLMERLMDAAARKSGIDRIELRRRNLIAPEELPYHNWMGIGFDSGNYPRMLDSALKRADVAGFAARRKESEARGRKRGLGIAYYVEITFSVGSEPARVKFTDNGGVEVYVGTQSNGQGHETAFAQIVAERLGVPFESITVRQGDTDWVNGGGTGGSRSLNMSGGAINICADEVIAKGKVAAGQIMQAGGKEIGFGVEGDGVGRFRITGTDRAMTVGELAVALKRTVLPGFETGLDSDGTFQGKASTFPNGCHVCEVEVDEETGKVDVVRYTVVDDFGRVINPMLVAGQVHGGVAQGIGQALLENCIYDAESGQLLTATFSDYAMPRAADLPDIRFAYEEIPCKTNDLGAKGCGEAGTVGALPAVISAIADAIGVKHIDMPATPERVWRAMREANTSG